MDGIDYRILEELGDIPLVERPFKSIAGKLGLKEEDAICRIRDLMDSGVIRRIGVSIAHRRVGVTANAMCMCRVPAERVDSVGDYLSSFPEITHCYSRSGFEYNMFFMLHCGTRKECKKIVKKISDEIGFEVRLLFSVREFKKTSFTI